jgi:hypothetical protein
VHADIGQPLLDLGQIAETGAQPCLVANDACVLWWRPARPTILP